MSFDDVATHDLARTHAAVVWSLWSWEAVLGPTVWPSVGVEKRVLLLEAEPELVVLVSFHHDGRVVTEVVGVWSAIGHPRLAHDQHIGFMTEGVWVHSHRA